MQDRIANIAEVRLVLQWFMEEPGHRLQSRWVEVRNLLSYQAQDRERHRQTGSLLDKGSESSLPVLLLVQSDRYDC